MDVATAVHAYLAGPTDLRAAVADLTPEQRIARPIPGKWSSLEVICHLADTDANIAHRLKRVLAEDRPTFDRVKPDSMLAALAYHERDASEQLALIDLGRRQIGRILNASSPEVWRRIGIVGDRGERTVAQMVSGAIEHLHHHLRFLIEKRSALGLGDPSSPNLTT